MSDNRSKSYVDVLNKSPTASLSSLAPKTSNISDIRWSMIDKRRYFPLTVTNMFFVRSLLYPLTLVRTRLQVQAGKSLYTGTFNALQTIIRYEGFLALYKGFWINSFQLFPHVLYITSYEVFILKTRFSKNSIKLIELICDLY